MKLTSKPAYCSRCFDQPNCQYVDMDAAWDGPVIDQGNGMKQTIDELIVCENCLREAAKLLGLEDPKADHEAMKRSAKALLETTKQLDKVQAYANKLEGLLAEKPKRAVAA